MKVVNKKLNKSQLITIWLLVASVLLLAAYFVVSAISDKMAQNNSNKPSSTVDIKPGESSYLNQPIAYPSIQENQILLLQVNGPKGKFDLSRYPDDQGSFMFHYYVDGEDGQEKSVAIPYVPPIYGAEGNFNYESLYAVEQNDGYGRIYYLSYLCSAIGIPYFTERIELPADEAIKNARLAEYGFIDKNGENISTVVSFIYGERDSKTGLIVDGSEKTQAISIGAKAISGMGYYFMVSGRDCVYYTQSEYFKYALVGFESFVKGMLVAEGIASDSTYEPYLTTDFKTWVGEKYDKADDAIFTTDGKSYTNPEIIVQGNSKTSVDKGLDFVPTSDAFDGYEVYNGERFTIDLEDLRTHSDYKRIKNILEGKTNGTYEDEIILTFIEQLYNSDAKVLGFSNEISEISYTYKISKIESLITDSGELLEGTVTLNTKEQTDGETVELDTLVKVTYRYTVGGKEVAHDCHAVINLKDLGSPEKEKLVGQEVGVELTDPIEINVTYTKENALKSNEKYVLTGVLAIFDENGLQTNVIEDTSYVTISYQRTVGGYTTNDTAIIRLCDIKDTDKLASLKTELPGKKMGDMSFVVYNTDYYYEFMREFSTYEVFEIEYFVVNKIIVSFEFRNASKRDPYYGETFFANTLENEYKLYGLNANSCEEVVKYFGGVGIDSSSALGFSGETVAVGLTLENMDDYELYAHRVYFKLPRGLYDASEGTDSDSSDALSDYGYTSELGFTLYISEPSFDSTGKRVRYIGSDMYDIVAKVDAEKLDFLEKDFVDFWARRNLVMMSIEKVQQIKLEFNMSDLSGVYDFSLNFDTYYSGYLDSEYVKREEEFEGSTKTTEQSVNVSISSDAYTDDYNFKLEEYLLASGNSSYGLTALYNRTQGDGNMTYYPGSKDTMGTAYFNSVYEILQMTRYQGRLTEEEQAAAFENDAIFSMYLKVEGTSGYYKYDFHRLDDRRIMVSLYRVNEKGEKISSDVAVSDFYVTTFAFKKIIGSYMDLLNGQEIDAVEGYPG